MQKIKNIIKHLIPKSFLEKRYTNFVIKKHGSYIDYDTEMFLEHTNVLKHDTELKYVGRIVQLYHIIEKGLTMNEMRLGFGQPKLINLIDECSDFQRKYNTNNIQYQHALGVIAEYKKVHEENQFSIDESLLKKINTLLDKEPDLKVTQQLIKTKDTYFEHQFSAFDQFSNSRHSIRNFSGEIKIAAIEQSQKATTIRERVGSPLSKPSSGSRSVCGAYPWSDLEFIVLFFGKVLPDSSRFQTRTYSIL